MENKEFITVKEINNVEAKSKIAFPRSITKIMSTEAHNRKIKETIENYAEKRRKMMGVSNKKRGIFYKRVEIITKNLIYFR